MPAACWQGLLGAQRHPLSCQAGRCGVGLLQSLVGMADLQWQAGLQAPALHESHWTLAQTQASVWTAGGCARRWWRHGVAGLRMPEWGRERAWLAAVG